MAKTASFKKRLSVILLIIFLSPILIKAAHRLYMHCEHHCASVSDKPELHEKHEKCPICSFDFTEIINNRIRGFIGKPEFILVYYTAYLQRIYNTTPNYSFNLRAPPVNEAVKKVRILIPANKSQKHKKLILRELRLTHFSAFVFLWPKFDFLDSLFCINLFTNKISVAYCRFTISN